MYEEDGITEDTEEIILKRQRISVDSARFSHKQTTAAVKRAWKSPSPAKSKKQRKTSKPQSSPQIHHHFPPACA